MVALTIGRGGKIDHAHRLGVLDSSFVLTLCLLGVISLSLNSRAQLPLSEMVS